MDIILCSSSKTRLSLLSAIGISAKILSTDIDETPLKAELPHKLASRLGSEKMQAALKTANINESSFLVTADTVSAVGRRILPKAENDNDVHKALSFCSGRRCKVYTGLCVAKVEPESEPVIRARLVTTVIQFKRLTNDEINWYVSTKAGIGCSGGIAREVAEVFIRGTHGSVSSVMGLPLYELMNLLIGLGFKLKDSYAG